jgi:hypothetical protein
MSITKDEAEEWVTVERYEEPTQAQMAKGMLEATGIECFLQGENANNLLASAFRVRLQVHPRDRAAALQMLSAVEDPADGALAGE